MASQARKVKSILHPTSHEWSLAIKTVVYENLVIPYKSYRCSYKQLYSVHI